MVGPYLLALVSLKDGSNRISVSRTIAKHAADNGGIGLTFGKDKVGYVLSCIQSFFEAILRELPHPLVFLVASYPGENDVFDIFHEELNVGKDSSKSKLLKFLDSMWNIEEIESVIMVLWDTEIPELGASPEYRVAFGQFIDWLKDYYVREDVAPDGHGNFRLGK